MRRPTAEQPRRIARVMNGVAEELGRAIQAHGPMRSAHEGYAVVPEEVWELERAVFCRERRAGALRAEAIQVAADCWTWGRRKWRRGPGEWSGQGGRRLFASSPRPRACRSSVFACLTLLWQRGSSFNRGALFVRPLQAGRR